MSKQNTPTPEDNTPNPEDLGDDNIVNSGENDSPLREEYPHEDLEASYQSLLNNDVEFDDDISDHDSNEENFTESPDNQTAMTNQTPIPGRYTPNTDNDSEFIDDEDLGFREDVRPEENEKLKEFIDKKKAEEPKRKTRSIPVVTESSPLEEEDLAYDSQISWISEKEFDKDPKYYKSKNYYNEGEAFDEGLTSEEAAEGLKGATDFTDYVEKDYKKKKLNVALITIAVAVSAFAALYAAMVIISSNDLGNKDPGTTIVTEEENGKQTEEKPSPISNFGDESKASSNPISIAIQDGKIVTSANYAISISGSTLAGTESPCAAGENEFCLAGTFTVEDTSIPTFFFHNITTSKVFAEIPEWNETAITGFPENGDKKQGYSGTGMVKLGPIESPSIIVVFEDQSGVLLNLPADVTPEKAQKILSLSKVG